MGNLDIYEKVRSVPDSAKKTIKGGRTSGMTDINPMWRIKVLTEQFGPCGIGWYYITTRKWLETSGNEIAAFVDIELYIKVDGEWSKPIPGNGGSMFASKEKSGMYVSDECYKMATTDAISVACKQLGIGADVYWESDRTKYNKRDNPDKQNNPNLITESDINEIFLELKRTGIGIKNVLSKYGLTDIHDMTSSQANETIKKLKKNPDKESATQPPNDMQDSGLP
ncbi:hypothetical protein [Enterocloster hominis (ex Hitch et al. 2024)]|uniref:Recombinase n=1 Tax=Enterocloster hominis (ex Hitch et al. 2024) TaxID=1917870 RepID=A0ABV1D2G4_9FIRM